MVQRTIRHAGRDPSAMDLSAALGCLVAWMAADGTMRTVALLSAQGFEVLHGLFQWSGPGGRSAALGALTRCLVLEPARTLHVRLCAHTCVHVPGAVLTDVHVCTLLACTAAACDWWH